MAPPASAGVLLPAAAAALMAMAALQLSAAAAAAPPPPPPPIGLPVCDTTCGDVSVPYPFGFGHPDCYWPGLNLTCDTSHGSPRLLLGDGSLRVTAIFLANNTLRVVRAGFVINVPAGARSWNVPFGRGFTEHGYVLAATNELVVDGCDVTATLVADDSGEENTQPVLGGCASFCTDINIREEPNGIPSYCFTNMMYCCQSRLTCSAPPKEVHVKSIHDGNHTAPVRVFVAEEGWVDKTDALDGHFELQEAPLLLQWKVRRDLPPLNRRGPICTLETVSLFKTSEGVHHKLCKSKHSELFVYGDGYTCQCDKGYEGNPYLADGCQEVDECKLLGKDRVCFGVCTNTIGSYDCQCPQGTYGDPSFEGGCVDYNFDKDAQLPTIAPVPTTAMPNCSTTCGNVSVPYPFGFGHPDCYWLGLNLTCDTSHGSPRLLLHGHGNDSNGTLQVVHISLHNSTVRVIHHSNWTPNMTAEVDQTVDTINGDSVEADVRLPDIGEPYALSTGNEFIFISPWDVRARLHGEYRNGSSSNTTNSVISQAVCSLIIGDHDGGYCSDHDGCCHAPIYAGTTPKKVEFKALNKNISRHYDNWSTVFAFAFISEEGLTDQWHKILKNHEVIRYMSFPIVLQWAVKHGFPAAAANNSGKCSSLCKSENSDCRQENGGFTCHCSKGYDGNPYVADGCKDIDECNDPALHKPCLGGYCKNLPGDYECQCPRGMHGNPYERSGCIANKAPAGLIIGLTVASVPALLLLVLGILFLLRKLRQHRIELLKHKYFKQNRGQLLQQLLSQKADIAEKMIIPLDELAKATNNFDKAREIGGGGHGTVYKGILSDQHVVAIKKSKITKQKEIDEFINEVAILSQINHKNVVKLFGCCLETEVPLLVYEFIPNGTLYHHLHIEGQERSLSWSNRLRIATEIATSLAYLHSSVSIPIIHRDIKSLNILLDDTMTSKISDFGASRYILIDNTVLTSRIQGTFGYWDPECFQTNRLTEKSDVYSFGVILVELLTRKKPTCSQLSNEYGGLVPHFLDLLASGNLVQIMDPQVLEEGGTEVQEVAMLAASCINLRGEERPTMRQVELTLEGLQQRSTKKYKKHDMVTKEFGNASNWENYSSRTEGHKSEESSRRYSLEQEMVMSASYPR